DRREGDQGVDDDAERVLVAELAGPRDGGHEIEIGEGYEPPVQASDDQQNLGDDIELSHVGSRCLIGLTGSWCGSESHAQTRRHGPDPRVVGSQLVLLAEGDVALRGEYEAH